MPCQYVKGQGYVPVFTMMPASLGGCPGVLPNPALFQTFAAAPGCMEEASEQQAPSEASEGQGGSQAGSDQRALGACPLEPACSVEDLFEDAEACNRVMEVLERDCDASQRVFEWLRQ